MDNPLAHWPRPLCFVLSGGGSYGAAHVGMIRALVESNIRPDLIVGSSVGALTGARVANNFDAAPDILSEGWRTTNRKTILGARTKAGLLLQMARQGRRTTSALTNRALRAMLEDTDLPERIEDLAIPTGIVVTDLLVGRPKVLRSGPLVPALLASTAIPGVFPSVQIEGCHYVDGGASANVPIRPAIAAGARSLIVLDCNPKGMPNRLPGNLVEMGMQASVIMLRNQIAAESSELAKRHPILRLPQTTPSDLNSFDFGRSAELIYKSYEAARAFLDALPEVTGSPDRNDSPDRYGLPKSEPNGTSASVASPELNGSSQPSEAPGITRPSS